MSPILALTSHSGDATPVLPVSFRVPFGGVMSAFHTLSVLEPGCYSEVWGGSFNLPKFSSLEGPITWLASTPGFPSWHGELCSFLGRCARPSPTGLCLLDVPRFAKRKPTWRRYLGLSFRGSPWLSFGFPSKTLKRGLPQNKPSLAPSRDQRARDFHATPWRCASFALGEARSAAVELFVLPKISFLPPFQPLPFGEV